MKKKAWIAVIVVIAIELVSMLGSYMVQTSGLSVKQEVITCSMNDLVKMINENNAKYGKDLGDTLSKGSDDPARAPAPRGSQFSRERASNSRARSRSSFST